jgi:hypothetical protein
MLVWAPASKIMRMLFGSMFGMELGGLLSVSFHAYGAREEIMNLLSQHSRRDSTHRRPVQHWRSRRHA